MEAKIMDLKQALKPNNNVNNKPDSLKNKDFNSALESVNNKMKNYKENSQKSKKTNSEVSSSINDNKDKTNDTEKSGLENEEKIVEKKDYQTGYEEMIFLFTNTAEIKSDDAINEEALLDLDGDAEDIILKSDIIDNFKTSEELNVEEKALSNEILKTDESKEYNMEESKTDKESNNVLEYYKNTNNKIDQKVDVNILLNKFDSKIEEKLSIDNINDSINLTQITKNSDLNNLDTKDNSEEPTQNQNEIITKTIDYEDDLDIQDKHFVFLEKSEIIVENTIEVDKTDTVDRKDLIQQIVDKVKFDLSESKNEIRIKLKPEVLGEMTMNIEVVKGEIIAKIMVDTQRTKEIIEANLMQLKEGIKNTALEIKTFEVFVGSGSDFDKHNSNQFNLKQNNKKIKIKADNNKTVKNYEENLLEVQTNSIGLYSENGLNLFA